MDLREREREREREDAVVCTRLIWLRTGITGKALVNTVMNLWVP
jgi:hypothetical protein